MPRRVTARTTTPVAQPGPVHLRVLLTNSFPLQAYAIVRSLVGVATWIGVGYTDDVPDDVALSRFVHAAVPVPDAGAAEEAFVARIESLCRDYDVNVVIPTSDHENLALASAREEFRARGIIVLAASADATRRASDKFATIEAAHRTGFPAPSTWLPGSLVEACAFAGACGYPVVLKARMSHGGSGVRLARNEGELRRFTEDVRRGEDWPIVQEYIPGRREPSINFILDPTGQPVLLYTLRKRRYLNVSYSTCIQTCARLPETDWALALCQDLGLSGVVAIQTKQDARDGIHKLVEVNPRWGANARIFLRMAQALGQNPVLDAIRVARGERQPFREYPAGQIGVSPLEDVPALLSYWRARRGTSALPDNPVPAWHTLLASYVRTYLSAGTVADFAWRGLRDDRTAVRRIVSRSPIGAAAPLPLPWGDLLPDRPLGNAPQKVGRRVATLSPKVSKEVSVHG